MVRINRVVTRGGDRGETSLGNGARVSKADPLIQAIGAVDEANAVIGIVRLHTAGDAVDEMLARIQNDLFDVGADLCVPDSSPDRLRVTQPAIERLEHEVTVMNERLPPLTSFILPGGTPAAAYAHLARTVVRRAECAVVAAGAAGMVQPYLNRLSDHLFVLARLLNAQDSADVLWVPGANQH